MSDSDEQVLQDTSADIFGRLGDNSIFSLPWPEQVFAIIYSAQGIIDNGGFVYFFAHDWHDQPPYEVFADAYRAVGAKECADCIQAAASLFPFPDAHRALSERRAYLRDHCADDSSTLVRLGDRVIDHSNDTFRLLAAYARRQLAKPRNA